MLKRQHRSLTTLELDPRGPEPAPLVIMLHGYGSNEKDLIQLAPDLPATCRYVSPRAPVMLDMEMFGWFPIEFTPTGITVDYAAAALALDRFIAFTGELIETFSPAGGKVFLMGFSQGAVMSYLTAFTRPDLLHGVIALSGQLPESSMPEGGGPEGLRALPFLVMHGIYDDVLPIEKGRASEHWLKDRVDDISYHEYPVAHQISGEGVAAIRSWIEKRTTAKS
ncbi:alpha/beta hydrolase [Pelodictyon luteolum]|uniref:Serine esterase n=1 Tax=Chlorobium luteolum (strain DSM 273 / BCRC 81028 / 2530) TaxID=319225 RepID=Q3B626_CHLL3|nr:alpha/beta fold hydrolase [Pelodictyon luteolum]ABB23205.1 serine esterase [Pelodictyon luteolum DSM 273]